MDTKTNAKHVLLALGLLGVAAGGFAGGLGYRATEPALPALQAVPTPEPAPAGTPALWADGNPATKAVALASFSELAKTTSAAVVFISTKQKATGGAGAFPPGHPFNDFFGSGGERSGLGSGFIINQNGHILTNYHVIEGADEIRVTLEDGEEYDGKVIGADEKTDVALVQIKASRSLPTLSLGDSEGVQVGDWAVAIGNPFGLDHSVTAGIISAKGRGDVDPGKVQGAYHNFLQTDASINPGNSGGPLINARGEVIGINTAINAAGQGIGFAIPINMVKDILPQLATTGKFARSWMGVALQPVTSEMYKGLGLSKAEGALVSEVIPGGPADKAGLKAGDVVVGFGGKDIKRSQELRWAVSTFGTDKSSEIKILRNGKAQTLSIQLQSFPENASAVAGSKSSTIPGVKTSLGISVAAIDASIAKKLGTKAGEGVLVVGVDAKSPAAGRLLEGDIVIAIGTQAQLSGKGLATPEEFSKAIDSAAAGKTLIAYVQRNGEHIFISFAKK